MENWPMAYWKHSIRSCVFTSPPFHSPHPFLPRKYRVYWQRLVLLPVHSSLLWLVSRFLTSVHSDGLEVRMDLRVSGSYTTKSVFPQWSDKVHIDYLCRSVETDSLCLQETFSPFINISKNELVVFLYMLLLLWISSVCNYRLIDSECLFYLILSCSLQTATLLSFSGDSFSLSRALLSV